jgi:hypothetical protein
VPSMAWPALPPLPPLLPSQPLLLLQLLLMAVMVPAVAALAAARAQAHPRLGNATRDPLPLPAGCQLCMVPAHLHAAIRS